MSDLPGIEDWKSLSQTDLERQYSPSSCIEDIDVLLAEYVRISRESESRARVLKDLKYGDGPDEALDLFPAQDSGSALIVFFHGGYWQQLSKNDYTFPGAEFAGNGVAFASVGYTLAPRARISEMIEQCRKSIVWLYQNANELGFDKNRIFLSGSSAGAHLASMVMLTDWNEHGLPADVIKGVTLMSGIYDLRPLCHTYINEPLGMDESEATSVSPIFRKLPAGPPAIICWGENETDEFKRQSRAFSRAWSEAGNTCETLEVPGYNHFDVVHTLSDPKSMIGRHVYSQLES